MFSELWSAPFVSATALRPFTSGDVERLVANEP